MRNTYTNIRWSRDVYFTVSVAHACRQNTVCYLYVHVHTYIATTILPHRFIDYSCPQPVTQTNARQCGTKTHIAIGRWRSGVFDTNLMPALLLAHLKPGRESP